MAGSFGPADGLEDLFGPNDDIGCQHAKQQNGRIVDQTVYEGQHDEQVERLAADMLKNPSTKRRQYLDSAMEEVSDPDEWADVGYRHFGQFNNERVIALLQGQSTQFTPCNRHFGLEAIKYRSGWKVGRRSQFQ